MDDSFVPLATYVRAALQAPVERFALQPPNDGSALHAPAERVALPAPADRFAVISERTTSGVAVATSHEAVPSVVRGLVDFAHADIVHELTLMRLAALEAFESGVARIVQSLARDVLARELTLAPADIDALANCAIAAFVEHEPVAIAVSPCDSERVRAPLPLRIDATLAAGDLIVYVRDGSFESRFAFRLDAALERAADRAAPA